VAAAGGGQCAAGCKGYALYRRREEAINSFSSMEMDKFFSPREDRDALDRQESASDIPEKIPSLLQDSERPAASNERRLVSDWLKARIGPLTGPGSKEWFKVWPAIEGEAEHGHRNSS